MFIAVTRITLPASQQEQVAQAFRRSVADLKGFDGFLGFELWRDAESLRAVSRWQSRAAMEAYQQSDAFRAHHGTGAQPGQAHAQHETASHSAHGGEGSHATHSASSAEHYDAEVVV